MVVSGRLTPFLFDSRPANSTTVEARPRRSVEDVQQQLAVVDQNPVAGRERAQDFRMRQIDARRSAERRVAVESEDVALAQIGAAAGEGAEPQFRSLQIDEDADRAAGLFFERANHRHALAHDVMRGVAHVDAEDVGAGGEQGRDGLAVARGGAEGGDDLDAAATGLQFMFLP